MKDTITKRLTVGILAHVDAGKTTLSEALLVASGHLKEAGRVDHGSAFLDTDEQEKARGITIFSKQARIRLPHTDLMLVDTPGHVDFSAEMERTLAILDAAILVINGKELVQGHTLTVWKLLARRGIPVFLFVNKMDLEGTDPARSIQTLKTKLDEGCVIFGGGSEPCAAGGPADLDPEELAVCDERILDAFLAGEPISEEMITSAVMHRSLFPVYFGSALKQTGVTAFLEGMDRYTKPPAAAKGFSARVYKITRDGRGNRLTHMKITGGRLSVRDALQTAPDAQGEEKVTQIRMYSGEKFETLEHAEAGMLVAVCGLEGTCAGQGLGLILGQTAQAMLQPVLTYRMILPEELSPHQVLLQMRELEEEDPQLHIQWNEALQEIQVRLMGEIQLEILQHMITKRFGFTPAFDEGSIEYRETVAKPVRGGGHFEPLRHYAEVHLLLEPLPEGSGILVDSSCSTDALDLNWQRLITTHILEREHPGVLTGAPITDMRITIEGGRAHLKHTEGGDFRQATYRALRQALRKAESVLLEPWYDFYLELPRRQLGKAMADIQKMGGSFSADADDGTGETVVLRGRAPVSEMRGYAAELASYTRGYGHLSFTFGGFSRCHNSDAVIRQIGYNPDQDLDHPADSIFCSHGAGRSVPWDEADAYMHVHIAAPGSPLQEPPAPDDSRRNAPSHAASEEDLNRIFEMTYGRKKEKKPRREAKVLEPAKPALKKQVPAQVGPEYLLVDGYNIIFAWEELRALAERNIDAAREALIEIMENYQGYRRCELILVFDAYKVKGGTQHIDKKGNITVVFTGEAETADTYIERTTYAIGRKYHVRVATSDRLEQMIILGNDAFRVSASEFKKEVELADAQIRAYLEECVRRNKSAFKNGIVLPLHTK